MVVKARPGVLHILFHVIELLVDIIYAYTVPVGPDILHIEGLAHIKTIQPYLIRVNILMPEAPLCSTGHLLHL